jgi:S1-C subfamily serine protease
MNEDMQQPEQPESASWWTALPAEQPESAPTAESAQPWSADQPAQAGAAAPNPFTAAPFGEMGVPARPAARATVYRRRAAVGAAAAAIGVVAFIATQTANAGNGNLTASGSSSSGLMPSWSNGTRVYYPGGFLGRRQSSSGASSGLSGAFGSGTAPSSTSPSTAANLTAAEKSAGQAAEKKVSSDVVDVVSRLSDGIGAGTGIVLSSNGLILTNNHVVDGAEAIQATDVANGKTYTAQLVGRDPTHDVAVLQLVGASGLPVAPISSTPAAVGDTVTGVGNGLGKGGTPSYAIGTVTGLNKSITATDEGGGSAERVTGMIESTTGILPGDSGGPLVNTSGQVVGMDTAGEFSRGNDDGPAQDSFAIPIATALSYAHELANGTDPTGTTDSSDGLNILGLPL